MLTFALLLGLQLIPPADSDLFRQPHVAVSGSRIALTYGAGKAVYFAASDDGGKTFSTPIKVAEGTWLALGRHRGPRVAVTLDSIVITAITGELGRGEDGDLYAWTSRDWGKTWSEAARINDVTGAAKEGLHAIATDGKGRLVAAWLDLRQPGVRLFWSESRDRGRTWSANKLLYESPSGSICECCHPSVSIAPDGGVVALFRNSVDGFRDMYIVRDGQALKAGQESWELKACPMDGGGLVLDAIGGPITVWRRKSEIYLSRKPGSEQLLGEGKDPAIALSGGVIFIGWTTPKGLMLWRSNTSASTVIDESGGFINLTKGEDGQVVAAWESGRGIRTRVLVP